MESSYEPIDDYIDFDLALRQAIVVLDEAARIALEEFDSKALAQIGRYWVQLAEAIAVHVHDEDQPTGRVGFVNE